MSNPAAAPSDQLGLTYASARGRWVLLATVVGAAIASMDATVVGIALPAIGRDFRVGLADLQWVVTAYTLTLAGLLLLAGALGDKYGRKRVFLIGVVWFALASVLGAVAPTAGPLVAARALQGVGAALLTPGSLAILEAVFRPDDRGKAIGAWSGFSGVGTAVGPFLGGFLVQAVSWRLIFVINLPLSALVVAVTLRHVPESRDPGATAPVDVTGGVLVTLGLVGLTYGLIQGPANGWATSPVLIALIVGVLLLGAFGWWEHRAPAPMLSLSLFRSTQFTATNVVTFIIYGAIGGAPCPPPLSVQHGLRATAPRARRWPRAPPRAEARAAPRGIARCSRPDPAPPRWSPPGSAWLAACSPWPPSAIPPAPRPRSAPLSSTPCTAPSTPPRSPSWSRSPAVSRPGHGSGIAAAGAGRRDQAPRQL